MVVLFITAYSAAILHVRVYYMWGDTVFHFAGGVCAALLVASYYHSEFAKLSPVFRVFSLVAITIGIGVLWEFHEYILSTLALVTHQFGGHISNKMTFIGDLDDTMKDLLMDTFGGIVVALWFALKQPTAETSITEGK